LCQPGRCQHGTRVAFRQHALLGASIRGNVAPPRRLCSLEFTQSRGQTSASSREGTPAAESRSGGANGKLEGILRRRSTLVRRQSLPQTQGLPNTHSLPNRASGVADDCVPHVTRL
jgi:hypothetical protein